MLTGAFLYLPLVACLRQIASRAPAAILLNFPLARNHFSIYLETRLKFTNKLNIKLKLYFLCRT